MSSEEYNNLNSRLDRIERLAALGAKSVLDLEDTSALTGLSKGHIYHLTSQKKMPHYKKSQKLYFKKQEIENWLTENRVSTDREIDERAETYVATHKRAIL